ncbi:MAG: tRNA pseudouridine(55) synthase TruB [Archangium sp.]
MTETRKRPPSAIWIYRKPAGETSSAVVARFREAHAGPWPLKASHGGVLDPFAQGLVLVLVGSANRLFEFLHDAPKRYVARVEWGRETDTGDFDGRTVREGDATKLTEDRIEAALPAFLGWKKQVPPNTSNKRVDGERAYEKAHRGEHFELPAQNVYLHSAQWLAHALPHFSSLELTVRGGFYVRSLATELGRALDVGAHLGHLERTHLGPWTHEENPVQLTGRALLPWLPSLELSDAEVGELRKTERFASKRSPTAPEWNVPQGYPQPPGVRLFHQRKLVAVVRDEKVTLLPGGC